MAPFLLETTALLSPNSSFDDSEGSVRSCFTIEQDSNEQKEAPNAAEKTDVVPPFASRIFPDVRRQVSFFSHMAVLEIELARKDYTEEELKACWYTPKEFEDILDSNQETIRKASMNMRIDEDTMRGLESQQHEKFLERRRISSASVTLVLNEQMRQSQLNSYDPELISECYQSVSNYATSRAIDIARFDALEARTINLEMVPGAYDNSADLPPCWIFNPAVWFPRLAQQAILEMRSEMNL